MTAARAVDLLVQRTIQTTVSQTVMVTASTVAATSLAILHQQPALSSTISVTHREVNSMRASRALTEVRYASERERKTLQAIHESNGERGIGSIGLHRRAAHGLGLLGEEIAEVLSSYTDLQTAVVKLAYSLAGSYRGKGQGATFPDFWIKQVLGEDFDLSILELYQPTASVPVVTQECIFCHESFQASADQGTRSVTLPPNPICPKCFVTRGGNLGNWD